MPAKNQELINECLLKLAEAGVTDISSLLDYSSIRIVRSSNDWLQIIGDRESEDEYSTEESDLGTCCGDISWCRDVLIRVQKNEYMTYLDFNNLKKVIDEHGGRDTSTLLGRFIEEATQSFSKVHQELSLSGAV